MKISDDMVSRFLTWPVPADVYPDGTPGQPGRTGTNLMTAQQARAMLEHVLGVNEMRAGQQIEQLQRQCEVLRAELVQARARVDNAVKILTGIHSCMYPSAVKMEDGRLMVFRPENTHEYMQALSDRIRALPDELEKMKRPNDGIEPPRSGRLE